MDVADEIRLRDAQQIVVTTQLPRVIGESLAAKVGFAEGVRLDHGSHGAVEDDDAFLEGLRQHVSGWSERAHGVSPPWPCSGSVCRPRRLSDRAGGRWPG